MKPRNRQMAMSPAEQVGACAFEGHRAIMEGGHEAFARRKEIYQSWKQ